MISYLFYRMLHFSKINLSFCIPERFSHIFSSICCASYLRPRHNFCVNYFHIISLLFSWYIKVEKTGVRRTKNHKNDKILRNAFLLNQRIERSEQNSISPKSQYFKIAQKVAVIIASEASFIYCFENLKFAFKQCYQTGHF